MQLAPTHEENGSEEGFYRDGMTHRKPTRNRIFFQLPLFSWNSKFNQQQKWYFGCLVGMRALYISASSVLWNVMILLSGLV